jgi:hypothetical protein
VRHLILQDVEVPIKWLSDLFDKYLPNTIFEMKKSFSHITSLGTMNFVTVRPTGLEVGTGAVGMCATFIIQQEAVQHFACTCSPHTTWHLLPRGSIAYAYAYQPRAEMVKHFTSAVCWSVCRHWSTSWRAS